MLHFENLAVKISYYSKPCALAGEKSQIVQLSAFNECDFFFKNIFDIKGYIAAWNNIEFGQIKV